MHNQIALARKSGKNRTSALPMFQHWHDGRCAGPDLGTSKNNDFATSKKHGFEPRLIGSHSLEAWGRRLNILKGDVD